MGRIGHIDLLPIAYYILLIIKGIIQVSLFFHVTAPGLKKCFHGALIFFEFRVTPMHASTQKKRLPWHHTCHKKVVHREYVVLNR